MSAAGTMPFGSVDGGELDPLRRSIVPVLRGGVALSFLLLAIGIALFLAGGGSSLLEVRVPAGLSSAAGVPQAPASGVVLLGFLVLAATPLARVVLSMGFFARTGDRDFTVLTGFVLAVLALTMVAGVTI